MTMLELDLLLGLIYSFLCLTFLKNPISYVQIDLTSERLYKQALVMKQICKLFPLSRVRTSNFRFLSLQLLKYRFHS